MQFILTLFGIELAEPLMNLAGDALTEPTFCGVGSKAICVEGRLFMHGQLPDRAGTHLNSTASPGADTLVLKEQVSWRANDTRGPRDRKMEYGIYKGFMFTDIMEKDPTYHERLRAAYHDTLWH